MQTHKLKITGSRYVLYRYRKTSPLGGRKPKEPEEGHVAPSAIHPLVSTGYVTIEDGNIYSWYRALLL